MKRALVLVLSLALAVGLAAPAEAHYRSHGDPRDTAEGLDIRRVRFRLVDCGCGTGRDVVVVVRTYEEQPGYGWFTIDFDGRGGPHRDRYVDGSWDLASGGFQAVLCRANGEVIASVRGRVGEDSFRVRFPFELLKHTRHVRWRVSTTLRSPQFELTDRAPDAGWFEH